MTNAKKQFAEEIKRAQDKQRRGKKLSKMDVVFLAMANDTSEPPPPRLQYAKNIRELADELNVDQSVILHYEQHPRAPAKLKGTVYRVEKWADFLDTIESETEDPVRPWERQHSEPLLWFARFTHFRLMEPIKRNLSACYKEMRLAGKGGPGSKPVPTEKTGHIKAPHDWFIQSQVWQWKSRAEAWDKHLLMTVNQREEERITLEREELIRQGDKVRKRSETAFLNKPLSAFSVYDAIQGMSHGNKTIEGAIPGLKPQPASGSPEDPAGPIRKVILLPVMDESKPQ